MIYWTLIRTDRNKERYVQEALTRMGYDAWWPAELVSYRVGCGKARKPIRDTVERAVLPKRLFAAIPSHAEALVSTMMHVAAIERDAASMAFQIPDVEIKRFRLEMDRLNEATRALAALGKAKPQKARWRSLKEALEDMVSQARQQLETAA